LGECIEVPSMARKGKKYGTRQRKERGEQEKKGISTARYVGKD